MSEYGQANPGDDRLTVICIYCEAPQQISRKALSVTCRQCHKQLRMEDVRIKEYQARRSIETVGVVTVEKKGQVMSDKVNCGGLIVRGKLKGNVTSRGPVLVGPEAELKGDVTAPSMAIGAGAVLDGKYAIGPKAKPVEDGAAAGQ